MLCTGASENLGGEVHARMTVSFSNCQDFGDVYFFNKWKINNCLVICFFNEQYISTADHEWKYFH